MHLSPFLLRLSLPALMLAVTVLGCNSESASHDAKPANEMEEKTALSATASGSDNPGIDLQCAAERIRKAPAPFHWSYRKIIPPLTNADWEADVATDSIAGTLFDASGTHTIRGAVSNPTSWNTAVLVLTGPLPASTFALVKNSSATTRAGTEGVNGENAIKYVIDTARADSSEAGLIRSVLGKNGSVKGTAWVTRTGCPVKFVLDVEQHDKSGMTQKEHYEANVTRR